MSTIERLFGRVKWFNNKAGYGFITAIDGPNVGTDIFAHHSAVNVGTEQYKYLVQGEYVEFTLSQVASGDHATQAADISGIRRGLLMCETHKQAQTDSLEYSNKGSTSTSNPVEPEVKKPASKKPPSNKKPRTPQKNPSVEGGDSGGEWSTNAKKPRTKYTPKSVSK
jgi:CspA family cold shock protein